MAKIIVLSDQVIKSLQRYAGEITALTNPPMIEKKAGCKCKNKNQIVKTVLDYEQVRLLIFNSQADTDTAKSKLGVEKLVFFLRDSNGKIAREIR